MFRKGLRSRALTRVRAHKQHAGADCAFKQAKLLQIVSGLLLGHKVEAETSRTLLMTDECILLMTAECIQDRM